VQDATSRIPISNAPAVLKKELFFARMRRVIRIGLFITFCCVLSENSAGAQQSYVSTSKPSPMTQVPTPIPLSEIASQAQAAMGFLRDIETSLATDRITTACACPDFRTLILG
jgi:hypothetical protein